MEGHLSILKRAAESESPQFAQEAEAQKDKEEL